MLTTKVFDSAQGAWADGLPIALEQHSGEGWVHVGGAVIGEDGEANGLLPPGAELERGTYQLTLDTGTYFAANELRSPYPVVRIVLEVAQEGDSMEVALELNPFGYSTHVVVS